MKVKVRLELDGKPHSDARATLVALNFTSLPYSHRMRQSNCFNTIHSYIITRIPHSLLPSDAPILNQISPSSKVYTRAPTRP